MFFFCFFFSSSGRGSTHPGLGGAGEGLGGGELLEVEAGSAVLARGLGQVEVAGLQKLKRNDEMGRGNVIFKIMLLSAFRVVVVWPGGDTRATGGEKKQKKKHSPRR